MTDVSTTSPLAPYLPRLVRGWSEEPDGPRLRVLDSSIVSIDISGFTALAERLQAKGKEGAEELVTRISAVFDGLIAAAERHGGDVLKFRGDALLLLFVGDRHAERACGAGSDMQWTIEAIGTQETTLGTVELRMSVGVHTADCHLFLTETPHRELLVAGPAATRVFELEDLASAGEIVMSAETAALVDPAWVGDAKEDAFLMVRLPPGASVIPPPPAAAGVNLDEYVPRPLRDHLAVSSGEAEHRQVTVAFLKLSGTDSVIASEGPEEVLARIDRLAAATGRACEAYGITWLESDIDVDAAKLYLTAGAPATSGDDEEGMLRALRDILAACPDLTLRAGVNRGHVFTGDIGASTRSTYAVMGDTVNLAARLCGKAEAGEILTVAPVLDRARTVYETATRSFNVKGKALEIEAHAIGEPVGRRDEDDRHGEVLVGREEELHRLTDALLATRTGLRQVAEIVGPPGIGKSRLLAELAARAEDAGFERVTTATDPYSVGEPYSAVRTLLRKVAGVAEDTPRDVAGARLAELVGTAMPDLQPWLPLLAIPLDADADPTPETANLDPERSRVRMHQVVEDFLARLLTNPTLVVVEDGHWLDDASEFIIRHLLDQPGPERWLIVVTTRPGTAPFAKDDAPFARRVELEPLPEDAAERLALELTRELDLPQHEIDALVERAGGSPLFVRELVAAVAQGQSIESLPDTVESLLTTRIDTLDPTDRLLLRYASVVGMSFELELLPEILGGELDGAEAPDRWRTLEEFVSPTDPGVLTFRHNLVRETAYEGLSFRRRREIHGRVGSVLEARAGDHADESAAILSLHFFEAGDDGRAWRYSRIAGDHAAEGFANVVAAELYDRALTAADRSGVAAVERAPVFEALGDVCERFAAYDRARVAWEGGADAAGDDEIARTRLAVKRGLALEREGRYDEALAAYENALVPLAALDDPRVEELYARVFIGRAGIRYRQARYQESIEAALQAIDHAEQAGDLGRVAHACYILDAAHTDLGTPDGLPYAERALRIYEDMGDLRGQGIVLNNLGVHAYYEGRWDEALRYYRQSRSVKERIGDVMGAAVQMNNEAEILSDQGRFDEAAALFDGWLRACRASSYAFGLGVAYSNLGRVASRSGHFDEAHELFAQALAQFEELGSERFVNETRARLAQCLVLEGRHAEALEMASACREAAAKSPVGGLESLIERTMGYALLQEGRTEEALPHFEEALRIARELKVEFEVALTLRALDRARGGDPEARRESEETLARLGVVATARVPGGSPQ